MPGGTGRRHSMDARSSSASDPSPSDYVDGVARPLGERQSPLPFGFAFENPRTFEPLSPRETAQQYDARLLAQRVFQNTSLLIAKLRTRRTRRRTGKRDRPGFGSPGSMDRVFFSCAACHVGRVDGVRQDEVPARHAEHGDRGAVLLEAADADRRGARRVRLRPTSTSAGESREHQAEHAARSRRSTPRCSTRRGCIPRRCTDRRRRRSPAQDPDAGRRRPVPERHAGSDRRRRQDALHLLTSSRRTTPTSSRCPTSSKIVPDRWMRSASPRAWSRSTRGGRTTAFWSSSVETIRRARSSPGFSKANGLPADMPGMTEPVDRSRRPPPIGSSRTSRHGRRRCRRRSTSRASTGRASATTPTGTATRAPRRARWRQAHRRPAIRAWSTCASTSR